LNVKETNKFFKEHNIVAIKADKGSKNRVDEMLALTTMSDEGSETQANLALAAESHQ